MTNLVLTAVGADRPGLVSALSTAVAAHGGSWLTSRMARLGGSFAGIVLVEAPESNLAGLRAALAGLAEQGLAVTVQVSGGPPLAAAAVDAAAAAAAGQPPHRMRLTLVGHDRPGIVAQVSTVLANHQVSIETMQTQTREAPMAGGMLFEVSAQVLAPAGTDETALHQGLEAIAGELMVEIELAEADDEQ